MPGLPSLRIRDKPEVAEPATDAVLIAHAQHDPRAFGELYDRYFDPVYRYCLTRLGDRAEAEDITSLIFAQVLTALPRYRDGAFRSWLFAIAHNAVANHHRARRPVRPLDDALEVVDAAPGGSPAIAAIAAEEHATLTAALAQLTPDQRRAVELRLAGLTGPEIAQVLGRSHAAVKMLQLRAVDRLREYMGVDAATGEARDALA
jgi:RNA polymerase sigma factor (sigma-70 family)